ncbi:MAG: hypothetical protein V7723_07415 [Sneathiella sp.]|uniref:hypothetical protein n=1 Tax=Sneathiella sp. TaxID=1964365 RepID=UPI0030010EF3
MPKILPFIIIVSAFGLFGWAGYDYVESGEEAGVINLPGKTGSSNLINLDPSMSPMRVLLKVDYEIDLLEADNKAFEYGVILKSTNSGALFDVMGAQRIKREGNTPEFDSNTALIVLATFDIPTAGAYIFDWEVDDQEAKISDQWIVMRRNVRPAPWPLVILGVVCFVLGIISLRYRQRRSGKRRNEG